MVLSYLVRSFVQHAEGIRWRACGQGQVRIQQAPIGSYIERREEIAISKIDLINHGSRASARELHHVCYFSSQSV